MQFSTIEKLLQDSQVPKVRFQVVDDTREVTMLLYYQPDTGLGLPEALYVMYDENMAAYSVLPQNILMVCKTTDAPNKLMQKIRCIAPQANVILVHWNEHGVLLNHLQMLFGHDKQQSADYAVFLRMIISGHDLSYVLTEAARQCDRQLVVVDFSGKILAYSRNVTIMSSDWMQFINDGYCSAEFMEYCGNTVIKRPEISSKPECYICQETGIVYYSSPIVIDRMVQGYVFMLSETTDVPTQIYEVLSIISSVSGDYIQRHRPELGASAQIYYRLMQDILEGESHDSIVSRIRAAKLKVPQQMRALVVAGYYYQNTKKHMTTLNNKLVPRFSLMPPICYENKLILVMNTEPAKTEYNQNTMAFLAELAKTYHLVVGISNEFYSLEDFSRAYRQADQALVLAERLHQKGSIVYYKELAFFDLLRNLSVGEHMKNYCHPALEVLWQYDAANNTNLFSTLKVYIETMLNLKETAERLFTHKNTIIYRRQRIIELTNLDFQDMEDIFNLAYSFRIYEYLGL